MSFLANVSDIMTSIASFLAVLFMFYKVTKRVRCPCCELETRDPEHPDYNPATPKSPGVIQIMMDKMTPRRRSKRRDVEDPISPSIGPPILEEVRRKKGVTIGTTSVV